MACIYTAARVEKSEWDRIPAVTLTHQPWLAPCDIEAAAQIRIVFIFGAAFRMLFNLAVNTIKNSRQES